MTDNSGYDFFAQPSGSGGSAQFGGPVPHADPPFGTPPAPGASLAYAPLAPQRNASQRSLAIALVVVLVVGVGGWFGWQRWQHRDDLHTPKTLGGLTGFDSGFADQAMASLSGSIEGQGDFDIAMAAYGTGEESFAFLVAYRGDDVALDDFEKVGGLSGTDLPGLQRVGKVQCAPISEQGKSMMMCLRGGDHTMVGVLSTFDVNTTAAMTNEAWDKV